VVTERADVQLKDMHPDILVQVQIKLQQLHCLYQLLSSSHQLHSSEDCWPFSTLPFEPVACLEWEMALIL
jgi:hypothetical protein